MKTLQGRCVLLTGASRGLGVHVARALAKAGANLVLVARSMEGLNAVQKEVEALGAQARCVQADLLQLDGLPNVVKEAEAAFGGVDVLVNNAALEVVGDFATLPLEKIDALLTVNLSAPIHLTRLLLPKMIQRGRGHILNVSSLAGQAGMPYWDVYSTTKHGLVGLTRSLRETCKSEGHPVDVSVVCPGFISEAGMYADMVELSGSTAPKALGTSSPEAVATACLNALVQNKAEVLINPMPIRPILIMNILFPSLTAWLLRKIGVSSWCRDTAMAQNNT